MRTESIESNVISTAVSLQASQSQLQYRELADVPVQEINVLEAVEQNLRILEDLQGRHSFLMREVQYLMKI